MEGEDNITLPEEQKPVGLNPPVHQASNPPVEVPPVTDELAPVNYPVTQPNLGFMAKPSSSEVNMVIIPGSEVSGGAGDTGMDLSSQPPTEEDTTAVENVDHNIQKLVEQNAIYERTNFNLNQELAAIKAKLVEVSTRNEDLEKELNSNSSVISNRNRMFLEMESSRNQLSIRVGEIEVELLRLKQEKDERDNIIRQLTKEKQMLTTENFSLKDELRKASSEKATLELEVENLKQDKRNLKFEREKAISDRNLFDESKKWFLKEIAERNTSMAQLRIEFSARESTFNLEKADFTRQLKNVTLDLENMKEKYQVTEQSLAKTISHIESKDVEHRKEVELLEKDLQTMKDLCEMYKDSMEKAEGCANEFKDQYNAREAAVQSIKALLEEVKLEMENDSAEFQSQLEAKDHKIAELEDEVQKANELLKNKHAVSINLTEEELASLSPAAAETSKFVKGGMTLTGMMREQARLAGELAAARETNKQLENTLAELCAEIEVRAPSLLTQKESFEKLFDENAKLKEQLETVADYKAQLEGDRDAAVRELAFTRAELEKHQRDAAALLKKNQHLLFVLEKERLMRDTESPGMTENDDKQLFESIGKLQKRNMQLESELSSERAMAAQAAVSAHNAELDKLKHDLESSKASEERLNGQLQQLNTAFTALQEQSMKFSAMVEDNVSAAEARAARQKAEEAESQLKIAELKIARLDQSVIDLKEKRDVLDKTANEKISGLQLNITELIHTRSKIEAQFEQQKQICLVATQDIEGYEKKIEKLNKERETLVQADADKARKIQDMFGEIARTQENCSDLRIRCTVLEEDVRRYTSNIGRLEAQLELLRSNSYNDQQVLGSLTDLTTRLTRIEAEKQTRKQSQLEILELENDTLKSTVNRVSNQLTQIKNEANINQLKLNNDITLVRQQLAEKENELSLSLTQLVELRNRLATVQSQYSGEDSTEGMSPERLKKECQQLKNRVQYLESDCEETKTKLAAAQVEVARKDEEMNRMLIQADKAEHGFVDTQKMMELERERLETKTKAAESRADSLYATVQQLRQDMANLDEELQSDKMAHLTAVTELNTTIETHLLQIRESQNAIDVLKNENEALKNDNRKKTTDVNDISQEMELLRADLDNLQSQLAVTENRLAAKENESMTANESARLAIESQRSSEHMMRERLAQVEADERKWHDVIEANNRKVTDVVKQYEELVTRVGLEHKLEDITQLDPDVPQAIIKSQQGLLQFLQEEKDSAVQRAMTSEVEVMRLRAEQREVSGGRDDLVKKIKEQHAELLAANAALVEKEALAKRVEELAAVKQQYERLLADQMKWNQESQEMSSKISQLNSQLVTINTKLAETDSKLAKTNLEKDKLFNEGELLKQRLTKVSQTKTEENTAQLTTLQKDLADSRTNATNLEKNLEESRAKFLKLQNLARKYRDETNVYKKKFGEITEGADAAAASTPAVGAAPAAVVPPAAPSVDAMEAQNTIARLNADIARLQAQVEELTGIKDKLSKDVEVKANELEEGKCRLMLITAKVSSSEKKIAALEKELEEANQQISLLQVRLSHSAAQSAPSAQNTSSQSLPPITISDQLPTAQKSTDSLFQQALLNTSRTQSLSQPRGEQSTANSSLSTTTAAETQPARIPAAPVFGLSQATDQPPLASSSPMKKSVGNDSRDSIASEKSSPATFSFVSSSRQPGMSLFGRSAQPVIFPTATPSVSSASNASQDLTGQDLDTTIVAAGQSSHVSGSQPLEEQIIDDLLNDSAGESRDSTVNVPVSSTDGSRKRPAGASDGADVKRQRESPNEAVTSSEERAAAASSDNVILLDAAQDDEESSMQDMPLEIPDDVENLEPDQEDVLDENYQAEDNMIRLDEIDEPSDNDDHGHQIHEVDDHHGHQVHELSSDNDEEDSDNVGSDNEDEEEDEDDDDDEGEDDDLNDDVDDDALEAGEDEDDDIIIEGDHNAHRNVRQHSIEQDREAASAVEDADDEGRESAGANNASSQETDNSSSQQAPGSSLDARRGGAPIVFADQEDQCSSSNETGNPPPARARRGRLLSRGIYQRGTGRGQIRRGGPPPPM